MPAKVWCKWVGLFACSALPAPSQAAPLRPRFEPTDLELLPPGKLGVSHQSAVNYGVHAWAKHWVASDLEIDLGWRDNVEFDIDWAISRDNSGTTGQWTGDPLWASTKLGLFDWHGKGALHAVAAGLQLGPRFPTWNSGYGMGYAALGLLGIAVGPSKLVINAGYNIDPGASVASRRPSACLLGLDLTRPLDRQERFALLGEIGTVLYTSKDKNEYDVSLGLAWDPSDQLEFSLVALGGQLANADKFAILFGVSPSFNLW